MRFKKHHMFISCIIEVPVFGVDELDRFHNSEEGKKEYQALFENHPSCKDVKCDETINELTARLERYKSGDFS